MLAVVLCNVIVSSCGTCSSAERGRLLAHAKYGGAGSAWYDHSPECKYGGSRCYGGGQHLAADHVAPGGSLAQHVPAKACGCYTSFGQVRYCELQIPHCAGRWHLLDSYMDVNFVVRLREDPLTETLLDLHVAEPASEHASSASPSRPPWCPAVASIAQDTDRCTVYGSHMHGNHAELGMICSYPCAIVKSTSLIINRFTFQRNVAQSCPTPFHRISESRIRAMSTGSEAAEPASRPSSSRSARNAPRLLCARLAGGYPHPADYDCPECNERRTGEVQLREPSEVTGEEEQILHGASNSAQQDELRERARARIVHIRAMSEGRSDSEGDPHSPVGISLALLVVGSGELRGESPALLVEGRARAQPQQASGYRGVMLDSDHSRLYSHNELIDRLEEAWQKGKRHGECWAFPNGFADGYTRAIDNVAEGSGYDRAKVVSWTGVAGEPGPKRRRVA